jgi:3',5'-cyclic AMP phosphodiesterase CpdA
MRLGVVTDVHLVFEGSSVEGSRVPDPDGWDFAATEGRLQAVVDRFEQEDVDGVVVLGDLSHHGDEATLDHALTLFGRLPRSLWVAPGNHDVGLSADALGRALDRAGRASPNGRRLDVIEIESADWIMSCRARSAPAVDAWGDELALIASHYPLIPRDGEEPAPPNHLEDGRELLEPLLARPAPTLVLSGHLHTRDAYADGPVLQLLFPSLIESPSRCSIVELEDGGVRLRRVTVGLDSGATSLEDWEFDGGRWVETA